MPGTLNGRVQWMTLQLDQSAMKHLGMGQAVKPLAKSCMLKHLYILGMWFAYMSSLNMSVIYLFCSCRLWSNDFLFFPSDVVVLRLPRPKSSTGSRKILRSSTPSLLCGAEKVPSFGPVVTALAVPRSLNGFHSPRPVQRDGQLQSHAMGRCSIYELNWHILIYMWVTVKMVEDHFSIL